MKRLIIFCFLLIIVCFSIAQKSIQKKVYYINNRFNIGISHNVFSYIKTDGSSYNNKPIYLHFNCAYRILKKKLISPELSLGFIYIDTKEQFASYQNPIFETYSYYWRQKEYNTYLRVAFDLQTKRKAAFLLNAGFFMPITITAIGFSARTGIKYNISDKLGISLCPEMTICIGNVTSINKKYGEKINGFPIYSDITRKGIFYSTNNHFIYCLRLGIHF